MQSKLRSSDLGTKIERGKRRGPFRVAGNEERLPVKEAEQAQPRVGGKPGECWVLEKRKECFEEKVSMILLQVWASDSNMSIT